jgi:D-glucosaminate-6-phosphate ammonia-lyase
VETTTSVYEEIGVTPVINAMGHYTVLGGATPSPRVKAAMDQAARSYVDMAELLAKAGETIARILGAEAAYVTSGAAAAIALGTAACITGKDVAKIARLPHTAGLKDRVVMQRAQRYHYDRVATIVGTTIVEAGDEGGTTAEQLAAALGPEAACVLYPAHLEGTPGTLPLRDVLDVAHAKGVPVLVDAAGQIYPLQRFTSFTRLGADLVCFGAKYIGAVNSSGILCGKRELVEAASMQGFIGYETASDGKAFGRPMKMDRQEIVGVVAALQEWFAMDHDQRLAGYERKLHAVGRHLEGLPGVSLTFQQDEGSSPRWLEIKLDPATARHSAASLARQLREGNPRIYVVVEDDAIAVNPIGFFADEEETVGQRIAALLGRG